MDEPETKAEGKKQGRSFKIGRSSILAIALVVVAVLWIASGALFETETTAEEQAPKADSEIVSVRVAEIAPSSHLRHISLTGLTETITGAEIRAETAGQVKSRPVEKGATVTDGTILIELRLDDRRAKLQEAEAQQKSAKLVYDASRDLQKKQFESQVKLAEASATLAKAEAALEAIQLDIARTKIRAPFDGFVEKLEVEPGDYVAVGDHVASVIDLDPMRVVVNVAERNIADVAVDDLATVRLPNGREVGGTVHFVSRSADATTRTFRVEIYIDNADGSIPAGQTAGVELLGRARPAHQIPPSAMTLDDEGRLGVRVVDDSETVHFHPISIIEDTSTGAWVTGLEGTVRLIIVGQEFVKDGQQVKAVPAGATDTGTSTGTGAGT
jgi:multidrug efflux system membrane fusion protein